MSWNYRIVRTRTNPSGEAFFEACEVYYDKDGVPWGYASATAGGETPEEVRADLARIAKDIEGPVLNAEDFNVTAPYPPSGSAQGVRE